jgi:hypothetical protein
MTEIQMTIAVIGATVLALEVGLLWFVGKTKK